MVAMAPHVAVAAVIGVRDLAILAPERNAVLQASVWYPAEAGGTAELIGENGVFRGTKAWRNAPVLPGQFPLIIIAHGGLRAAPNMVGWLASMLAASGFIAVVTNPPKIPSGPPKQSILNELWLRPGDLSAAITATEKDPVFGKLVDVKKVVGVGFFLGGYSILALAGARIDPEAYSRICSGQIQNIDCRWFAKGGVKPMLADAVHLGRSNLDPRVKGVVAIDPELASVLSAESLRRIRTPVYLIRLGSTAIPPALDPSLMNSKISKVHAQTIENGTPFSSFAECKPEGAANLASDGDETELCADGDGDARADIHAQLAAMIVADLGDAFVSH
jgi:predicted dienelactone hydrolase